MRPPAASATDREEVVERLIERYPALAEERRRFAERAPRGSIEPEVPSLHIDDFSAIDALPSDDPLAHECHDSRAFARARGHDLVAGRSPEVPGYIDYIDRYLDLGRPGYVEVGCAAGPSQNVFQSIAASEPILRRVGDWCREHGGELALHPYMGHPDAWRLAQALDRPCGSTVTVVAPPPTLGRLVNNRLWFAELVRLLLGPGAALESYPTAGPAAIVERLLAVAESAPRVALRVATSATGAGLSILRRESIRERPRSALREWVERWLEEIGWTGEGPPVGVERWEPDVACSPSVQLWIPTPEEGPPVVDGIFEQHFERRRPAVFDGSTPARLPEGVLDGIRRSSLAIAAALQRLGYVGRCSFDLILCGSSVETATLRFVECNGRWGGTSTPMSLMDRLFGDHRSQPYAARNLTVPALAGHGFSELLSCLREVLYDRRRGRGWVIVYNPACVPAVGILDAITLGETQEQADRRQRELVDRLSAHFSPRAS